MSERLHKRLARAGVASRRACEEMIKAGRITVNGIQATLGQLVDERDDIRVDGQLIQTEAVETVTFALYKPRGYVTTAHDEFGRRTVLDGMPRVAGLHPIGRLDRDSEGLLLLTTDGTLTHTLTHPSFGHEKAYRAWTEGQPHDEALEALMEGVELEDGLAKAVSVSPAEEGAFVVLAEGRNRQVRRMLAAVGFPVTRLLRYRVGGLWLGDLDVGEYKTLHADELELLVNPARGGERWEQEWHLIRKRWG